MLNITTQRQAEFGLPPQGRSETDTAFRHRIAGALRQAGHLVEAHEAQQNCLYDDPANPMPMLGIAGALAQALQGRVYSPHNGVNQVGDDIAAGGYVVCAPSKESKAQLLLLLMLLMGDD